MDYKDVIIKLTVACLTLGVINVAQYVGAQRLIRDLKNGTD